MVHILPSQSFIAWRVFTTLLHVLAILSTIFRVSIRWRIAKMWWDDYMVLLPAVTDIYICATLWVYPAISRENLPLLGSLTKSIWISTFPTFTVVWLSRICTLLSLGRIFPSQHANRQRINLLIVFFAIFYIICLILTAVQCDLSMTSNIKLKFCRTYPVFTIAFTMNVISDIILVVCPMVMFREIRFPSRREKQMILAESTTSIFTTLLLSMIANLAYGPFKKDISYIILVYMLAHMVAAVTLLSCNLLVVASAIYCAVRASGSASSGSAAYTESEKNIPTTLTELSHLQEPQIRFFYPSYRKPLRRHSVP